MGYLSSSVDTITIDAILTDLGRELLSRDDGSFNIVKYAFGDDGIDYRIFSDTTASIEQTEQLILTVPNFEAPTNEDVGLKYPLITITDSTLITLPILKISGGSTANTLKETGSPALIITFAQEMEKSGEVVPGEILDNSFLVEVNNLLLNVLRDDVTQVPISITPLGTSQYELLRDSESSTSKGGKLTVAFQVKALSDDVWNTLGLGNVGSRTITAYARVSGLQSGLSYTYTITIEEVAGLRS